MAFGRRDIRGGAVQTTITSGITNASTSCAIASATGWPDGGSFAAFYVVIDPGLSTEEKILCSTRSTLTVNFTTRGADGTSASAHASGAAIYPIVSAVDIDEANNAVSQTIGGVTTKGDILAATAANTLARLAVGSNGLPLVANSAQTTGLGYAALAAAGLAADSVITAKILDANVTTAKIASGAVTATELGSGAVTTAKIAAGAVTATELGTGAVTSAKILDGTIATGDIAAGAITATELATGAVTSAKILDGTIAAGDIAADAITTVKILDGNVTEVKRAACVRVSLRRANAQSITSGLIVDISWDTEDADASGFIAVSATDLVVPVGLGGIYSITSRWLWASSPNNDVMLDITLDSTVYRSGHQLSTVGDKIGMGITEYLTAGTHIKSSVFQLSGGAITGTGSLSVFRLGT